MMVGRARILGFTRRKWVLHPQNSFFREKSETIQCTSITKSTALVGEKTLYLERRSLRMSKLKFSGDGYRGDDSRKRNGAHLVHACG